MTRWPVFTAIGLALALWLLLLLMPAHGGQPSSCPVPGHEGPRCHMGACASYDKNGKVTGAKCSKDCAEKCCSCPGGSCNRHHEAPNDEAVERPQ